MTQDPTTDSVVIADDDHRLTDATARLMAVLLRLRAYPEKWTKALRYVAERDTSMAQLNAAIRDMERVADGLEASTANLEA